MGNKLTTRIQNIFNKNQVEISPKNNAKQLKETCEQSKAQIIKIDENFSMVDSLGNFKRLDIDAKQTKVEEYKVNKTQEIY